ncbi:hypothetical protein DY245_32265 [Streptomyces inhibens]|uniref:Uncharacterized protein n=1 Tax=Streptomyces inhibens TaxID=2293571 RepID=A0A371PW25_STRIH|nr:hypothetical protein DY245_32265 [Streptomyces inhibens]
MAAAFGGVVAAAVGGGVSWWAGRENASAPASPRPQVRQVVVATDNAEATQVAGHHVPGSRTTHNGETHGDVDQQANIAGQARITQIGGDHDRSDR